MHQKYVESIRSDQRDEAATNMSEFAYYKPLQSSDDDDDDDELFNQPHQMKIAQLFVFREDTNHAVDKIYVVVVCGLFHLQG